MQADVQRIVEIYRRNGRYDIRVEPKIIDRPNNRVDLVFEINEGGKTDVKEIDFVGNRAYSTWRLRDVIKTGAVQLAQLPARTTTSTIRTASRPTATCCAASI